MINLKQELERIQEELKTEDNPNVRIFLCERGIEICHILGAQKLMSDKIMELFGMDVNELGVKWSDDLNERED